MISSTGVTERIPNNFFSYSHTYSHRQKCGHIIIEFELYIEASETKWDISDYI